MHSEKAEGALEEVAFNMRSFCAGIVTFTFHASRKIYEMLA